MYKYINKLKEMLKISFDLIVSVILLILLLPIFFWISRKVKKNMGDPIIFKHERPGLHGHIFKMYKFRSMLNAYDNDGIPLADEQRLTSFGQKLRSSSLDELPALWNVLKGDMSLVGPRPLLVEYLPLYNEEQARRHNVKPGITGWAQVNGRNTIGWEEKFKLDVWYVDNQSFWLDLKILFLTVKKVFLKEDISHNDHVTMLPFKGNNIKTEEN